MTKGKSTKGTSKKGQRSKVPRGNAKKAVSSRKRQVQDHSNSMSSNSSQKQSQKRHKKKRKDTAPVESVNSNSDSLDEPEVIDNLDELRAEGTDRSVEVCAMLICTNIRTY